MSCLDDDTLAALFERRLSPDAGLEVAAHLADCAACRRLVARGSLLAEVAAEAGALARGDVVAGKFRIVRVIGRGGMGIVYAATHLGLGHAVALKVMAPKLVAMPDAVSRFLNEARAAARIDCENVARVLDVGTLENGAPFIAMERLHGSDLASVLAERGPLPVAEAADIVVEASLGVAHAHALGIIHRDLKPANLFLVERPVGSVSVKVLDFGISKATNPFEAEARANTTTEAVLGSPHFMSPEQLKSSKHVDARTDIWALGVVLYQILSDALPFEGDTIGELLFAIAAAPPTPLRERRPDAPRGVERVIARCLARDVSARWPDVGAFARALAHYGTRRSLPTVERITQVLAPGAKAARATPRFGWQPVALIGALGVVSGAVALALTRTTAKTAPEAEGGPCPSGMVEISGGVFIMGSDDGTAEERPPHEMTVASFCLDRTEVTTAAYTRCVAQLGCTPAAFTVSWEGIPENVATFESAFCRGADQSSPDLPVNCVSWNQADAYCTKVGKRLPTEAEWEFAARNGSRGDPYPWGTLAPDATRANLCDEGCALAWARGGFFERRPLVRGDRGHVGLAPVGSFPDGASRAGVLDLIGNVWEWTSSDFCVYPATTCENLAWVATSVSHPKVFRGGSFETYMPARARATARLFGQRSERFRFADVGFRCASDVH
jgi:formylglycine-generating enzyme required for sulfatase activity/tRNA A-37 threonylcarbamoyl transferase component Bud32